MNEKLQYATMLEIPVNTCNITYKPQKKKKKNKKQVLVEDVKDKLLKKINGTIQSDKENPMPTINTMLENDGNFEGNNQADYTNQILEDGQNVNLGENYLQGQLLATESENQTFNGENSVEIKQISSADKKRKIRKEKRQNKKSAFLGVQLAIIGALIGIIFLTNSFYPNSALNVVFNSIFGSPAEAVAEKTYNEFSPVLSLGDSGEYLLTGGTVSCTTSGTIYPPCSGVISSVTKNNDGKFSMEIEHTSQFKSIISGLDYAYHEVGEKVFDNIPVGYVSGEEVSLCFVNGEGEVITNYQLDGNSVLWAV